MRRLAALVLAPVLVVVAAVAPASAGPLIDEAAAALRRDPVYVAGSAERAISGDEAESLRKRITAGSAPIYIAILPAAVIDEVGGDASRLPMELGQATGLRGSYAVVAGNAFRAGSNALPRGAAGEIATDAFNDNRDGGPAAVLAAFVEGVQRVSDQRGARDGGGGDRASRGQPADERRGVGMGTLLLLGLLALGAVLFLGRHRAKGRAEEDLALSAAREDLSAELSIVADDVMALEPEVTLHPDARADYDAGVSRYRWLQAAVPAIDSPDDVPRVRRAMAEARYTLERVRARSRGVEPPPPPPELREPGPTGEPAVTTDERGEPVYVGYQPGSWYGGGFFAGNGLFTGLLLGSMLGGFGPFGYGWGGGYGGPGHDGTGVDGGNWGGGGDWGGGDWGGGGDFGGGTFGGGGGGDW